MTAYKVRVYRTEIYCQDVMIEADNPAQALSQTNDKLQDQGWDAVCGDDEGEYCECYSDAEQVACPVCDAFYIPGDTRCDCHNGNKEGSSS